MVQLAVEWAVNHVLHIHHQFSGQVVEFAGDLSKPLLGYFLCRAFELVYRGLPVDKSTI